MPHIIIEASQNIVSELDTTQLVSVAHDALADQLGDGDRIKTRLIVAHDVVVGNKGLSGAMIHVTLLLLEGRDEPTKQAYAKAIYDAIKTQIQGMHECALTLEVRDMDKATYMM
ncbi:MAG: hypothetical protein AAF549_06940 [Pseudomonadota bacterium]